MELRPSTAAAFGILIAGFAMPALAQGDPRPSEGPKLEGVSEEEARRLEALGYLDYSPDLRDADQSGVARVDLPRSAPGHTLVVSSVECAARLIDLSGRELHSWSQPDCVRWWSAELLQDGDLVVNGGRPAPAALGNTGTSKRFRRFVARIGWAGELVWRRDIRAHHQLDWTPAQEILVLIESQRSSEEVGSRVPDLVDGVGADVVFHDNALVWLGANGKVRETLSLLDATTTGAVDFAFLPRGELLETGSHVGLFHANSADAMDQPHLVGRHPLFSDQSVLVTSRNQNRIFVVDRRSRSLVWEWGRDVLQAPHDATWLANGHVLVFDNGIERRTSRVLEVDPIRRRIVWKYPDAAGVEFHSETRGLAQRLPNGNTLITDSQGGQAFEVTPAGATVWHYFAPPPEGGTRRPVIMSLHRYPESWLTRPRE